MAAKKKKKKTKTTKKKTGAPKRRFHILSLDGGGIRGVLTSVWLEALEKHLPGPLYSHFDIVAGTSTGSILACAVSAGIPAAEIRERYMEFGREVFPGTAGRLWSRFKRTFSEGVSAPKYSDVGLERALRRQFGEKCFGELEIPTIVTSYDTLGRQAIVLKTAGKAAKETWRWDHIPVWEITKASSSAPTYFPAHVMRVGGIRTPLIDGGVVANNPTACAIAEGIRQNRERPPSRRAALDRFVIASFGTGETTRPITISDAREWGAVEWALPIIDVLFDGASDAVHYIASQISPGSYFRFQTKLDGAFDDMDDASETNINALMRLAQNYLASTDGSAKMNRLVEALS